MRKKIVLFILVMKILLNIRKKCYIFVIYLILRILMKMCERNWNGREKRLSNVKCLYLYR